MTLKYLPYLCELGDICAGSACAAISPSPPPQQHVQFPRICTLTAYTHYAAAAAATNQAKLARRTYQENVFMRKCLIYYFRIACPRQKRTHTHKNV